MQILIVTGITLMFAATVVMYYFWKLEADINAALAAENSELRNALHNALNVRKAKSRGITGKYRKAIDAHRACCESEGNAGTQNDRALWFVLDSEAV